MIADHMGVFDVTGGVRPSKARAEPRQSLSHSLLSEKVFLRCERTVLSRDDGLSLTLDQVMRAVAWRGVAYRGGACE